MISKDEKRCIHREASVLFDSGSISGWILRDLNGFLNGSQKSIPSLSSERRAKTLRPSDQETHHHVSILLNALSYTDKNIYLIH